MRVAALQVELLKINYSFIIPVKNINEYIYETILHIQKIERNDWELLVIPDAFSEKPWADSRIQILPSGRQRGPAYKRDFGAKFAKGGILVFLDDDSYPNKNLLDIADNYLKNSEIIALGGPGVPPPQNTFLQKVSGAVFLSRFSGGAPERYVPIGKGKKVFDWPSVNLMVRKEVFEKVDGFNSEFWPGEDTLFCQKLLNLRAGEIYYAPEMIVWHHRRPGLGRHLKQIGAYALHRGYFAKKFGGNSSKILYFIPSGFVIYSFISLACFLLGAHITFIYYFWLLYIAAITVAVLNICKHHSIGIALAAVPYIFLTHLWYGVKFSQGFMVKKIISKLR